jgi:acetolactate synthase-1/2/3 large subunit
VNVIFGLPGVQLDWAFDALYDERDHLYVYHTRHEQATTYMADGYARTTGRVGVALVVPGPGLLNASAGLATAYACSSPVLCIAGQIASDQIGRGRGMLHEIKNQIEMIGSVTKWAGRAMRPAEVPDLVHEAFRHLLTGRPRPVEIEIPPDVLQGREEVTLREPAIHERVAPDPDQIDLAAQLLGRSQRPLIWSGGGVLISEAWDELRRLAEALEAPVVMTAEGKGALSYDHYLALNAAAGREVFPNADVVLAVGTRFLQPATQLRYEAGQKLVQMDIDPEEVGRNRTPDVGIVADAKLGLDALAERVQRYNRPRPSRRDELQALKAAIEARFDQVQPQAAFARAIRAELPEDGIFVNESTQVGYWASQAFPVFRPRTFLSSGYQGTLGYGFATALGAKAGNPATPVISINGDGGFMYNVQELATMVLHNLPVVVVVFNDNAYGNVRRSQRVRFRNRIIATDLYNPDFMKLAEAFGIAGERAANPEELRRAVRRAVASSRPSLIEVPVQEMPYMGEILGWGGLTPVR